MNRKLLWIVLVEALVGFSFVYYLTMQANTGSNYESFGLEYMPAALALLATLVVMIPTIFVGTIGGLAHKRGNKWLNIIIILGLITVIAYYVLNDLVYLGRF